MRVLLYKPTSPSGKLICWWTHSKYCHVSIVANGVEWETTKAYGVRGVVPRSNYAESVTINDAVAELKAEEYIRAKLGVRYGIANILRFVFPWIHEQKRQDICSTLVWGALRSAGLLPFSEDIVSPGEVGNAAKVIAHFLQKQSA